MLIATARSGISDSGSELIGDGLSYAGEGRSFERFKMPSAAKKRPVAR